MSVAPFHVVGAASAVTAAKTALRNAIRLRLRDMVDSARAAGSTRIVQRLSDAPLWTQAASVLGFVPMNSEPDILGALRSRAEGGRTVALPRWNVRTGEYEAAGWNGVSPLCPGPFNVPEPSPGAPVIPLERLDLILVPGLAFDRKGRRLGRGKGFFDRLLARASGALRWGVAFDVQVVDEVPSAAHDANIQLLVTPDLWWPVISDVPG